MLIDDTLLERDRTRPHAAAPVGRPRRSRAVLVGSVAACLILGLIGLVSTGASCGTVTLDAFDTATRTWRTIDVAHPDGAGVGAERGRGAR